MKKFSMILVSIITLLAFTSQDVLAIGSSTSSSSSSSSSVSSRSSVSSSSSMNSSSSASRSSMQSSMNAQNSANSASRNSSLNSSMNRNNSSSLTNPNGMYNRNNQMNSYNSQLRQSNYMNNIMMYYLLFNGIHNQNNLKKQKSILMDQMNKDQKLYTITIKTKDGKKQLLSVTKKDYDKIKEGDTVKYSNNKLEIK